MNHRLFERLALSLAPLIFLQTAAGFTVSDPSPLVGPAGSSIEILGDGFDVEASYVVTIGSANVTVDSISETALQVTIPADAESGYFVVSDGLQSQEAERAFLVTREISVSYSENLGTDVSGYDMGTTYSTAEADGDGFTLQIDTTNHSLVLADAEGASSSPIYGIARLDEENLVLGASSTVEAFALMTGLFYSPDKEELSDRIDFLRNQSTYSEAVEAVQAHLTAGTSWVESEAVDAALETMLTEFFGSYDSEEPGGSSQYPQPSQAEQVLAPREFVQGFFNLRPGYPRELEASGWDIERLTAKPDIEVPGPGTRGTPVQKIKMDAARLRTGWKAANNIVGRFKGNPLDWSANLYALDIDDPFLDTAPEVDGLTEQYWNYVYDRVTPDALDRLLVSATSVASLGNLEVKIRDGLIFKNTSRFIGNFVGTPDSLKLKDSLTIPTERPGIYMIHSFSGAFFDEQRWLIENMPGGEVEDSAMFALNMTLAANDLLGLLLGKSATISKSEWLNFSISLQRSITVTLLRKKQQGTHNSEAVQAIFWEVVKAVRNFAFSKLKSGIISGSSVAVGQRFSNTLNVFSNASKSLGRISSGLKLVERAGALSNSVNFGPLARVAFALEDSLVVVGNPWAPTIDSFEPTEAYWGETVTLYGDRFSTVLEDNIVTFGTGSTSDPESVPADTRAEVLSATKNSIIVKVPENSVTGAIIVTVVGNGTATTAPNAVPYDKFTRIPDPVIESNIALSPVAGTAVRLLGKNFPTRPGFDFKLRFFDAIFDSIPVVKSDTEMYVFVPVVSGEQALTMKMLDRQIGAYPIEVLDPPTPPDGLSIQVITPADGNARDDVLTLREAMMLADGTLGVGDLTKPPAPPEQRPPGTNYETDYVFNSQLGADSKTTISYTVGAPFEIDEPVQLTEPLPSVTNFDEYNNVRIDGLSVTGQPLVLDGTEGATLNLVRIFNSSQDGILLKNGATRNTGRLIVEKPLRHGIHFEDSATSNEFTVSVLEPEENGIHLSGPNVFGNTIQVGLEIGLDGGGSESQAGSGNWGAVIENGASFNKILIDFDVVTLAGITGFEEGGVWVQGESSAGNQLGSPLGSTNNVYFPVHGNRGPGILVEGARTHVNQVNVYGNRGHGVTFGGLGIDGSSITSSRIGFNSAKGEADANEGSGIYVAPGSRNLLIGSKSNGIESQANSIGGNLDHGILMEGPGLQDIEVNATTIGTVYYGGETPTVIPNGEHGIALMKGASNVTLGDPILQFGTHVTDHTNGAAIYLHGTGTQNNQIIGVDIGVRDSLASINYGSPAGGNAVGIHITGGAHSNQIGLPSERTSRFIAIGGFPEFAFLEPWNEIYNNDIGILLESGGDPTQTVPSDLNVPFEPQGGNIIVNNRIGDEGRGNQVGIKITSEAERNRVGGVGDFDGNRIYSNRDAGIWIDGVVASRPEVANRIVGNEIRNTGEGLEAVPDPREGVLAGVGILLSNDAEWQIVGGDQPGEGNTIQSGIIGIGFHTANDNFIRGNDIGGYTISGFPNSTFLQNEQAGVFLYESVGNEIGPGNNISGNGLAAGIPLGGVYVYGGSENLVIGNKIGSRPDEVGGSRRNNPAGVTLDDTLNNSVGTGAADGVNEIGRNLGVGVHITGEDSLFNRVENNYIGTNRAGVSDPNSAGGVLIDGGAFENLVYDNIIQHNADFGVRVDGASSGTNTISINSIYDHPANTDISLTNGGNNGIQPPTMETQDGFTIEGSVAEGTPDGSIVEFFSDPGSAARTPIGSATVMDESFTFSALLAPFLQLTATLTNPDGDTSELSSVFNIFPFDEDSTLDVRRTEGEPEEITVAANQTPIAIMPIVLTAPEDLNVTVEAMTFSAAGSIDESLDLDGLVVYHDEDRDGIITSEDTLLSEVTPIPENDGEIEINFSISVREGERENLILAAIVRNGVGGGETLEFTLESALMVESVTHLSSTPVAATGVFPVIGNRITLSEPIDAYDVWRDATFSPEDAANDDISGRNEDPDEDGIPNLLEFALGTDPFVKDVWNDALISVTDNEYVFQIPVAESTLSEIAIAEVSNDLISWTSGNEAAVIKGSRPDGNGGYYLVVSVPRPASEATPVFVRLHYPST